MNDCKENDKFYFCVVCFRISVAFMEYPIVDYFFNHQPPLKWLYLNTNNPQEFRTVFYTSKGPGFIFPTTSQIGKTVLKPKKIEMNSNTSFYDSLAFCLNQFLQQDNRLIRILTQPNKQVSPTEIESTTGLVVLCHKLTDSKDRANLDKLPDQISKEELVASQISFQATVNFTPDLLRVHCANIYLLHKGQTLEMMMRYIWSIFKVITLYRDTHKNGDPTVKQFWQVRFHDDSRLKSWVLFPYLMFRRADSSIDCFPKSFPFDTYMKTYTQVIMAEQKSPADYEMLFRLNMFWLLFSKGFSSDIEMQILPIDVIRASNALDINIVVFTMADVGVDPASNATKKLIFIEPVFYFSPHRNTVFLYMESMPNQQYDNRFYPAAIPVPKLTPKPNEADYNLQVFLQPYLDISNAGDRYVTNILEKMIQTSNQGFVFDTEDKYLLFTSSTKNAENQHKAFSDADKAQYKDMLENPKVENVKNFL